MAARPGSLPRSPVTPTRSISRSADGTNHAAQICTDCHQSANTFADFTCVSCHDHSEALAAPDTSYITGFVYQSSACFSCHPTGNEGAVTPDEHSLKYFPITDAAHGSLACSDCHQDPTTSKPFTCVTCHDHGSRRGGDEPRERRRLRLRLDLLLQLPWGAERLGPFVDTAVCRPGPDDTPAGPGTRGVVASVPWRRGARGARLPHRAEPRASAGPRDPGRGRADGAECPDVVAPGHRSRRLHRQRILYHACPEGKILGLVNGVATLVNASKLHRPRPVRGRVPGRRHQAGVRHRASAASTSPRSTSSFETSRAGRPHRRRARRDGPHQERAHAGAAGGGALEGRARIGGAPRWDGELSTWRSSAPGRPESRGRRRAGRRPLVRAAGAGHGRRHGRALPAAKAGHDRDRSTCRFTASSGRRDRQGGPDRVRFERVINNAGHRGPREGQVCRSTGRRATSWSPRARRPAGTAGRPGDRPARHAPQLGVPGDDLAEGDLSPDRSDASTRANGCWSWAAAIRRWRRRRARRRRRRRSGSSIARPSSAAAGRSTRKRSRPWASGRLRGVHVDGAGSVEPASVTLKTGARPRPFPTTSSSPAWAASSRPVAEDHGHRDPQAPGRQGDGQPGARRRRRALPATSGSPRRRSRSSASRSWSFSASRSANYYMLPASCATSHRSTIDEAFGSVGPRDRDPRHGVMLLNFVYPIRKRARWLKRRGVDRSLAALPRVRGDPDAAVILFHSRFAGGTSWRRHLRLAGGRGRDRALSGGSSTACSASTPRTASGRRRCAAVFAGAGRARLAADGRDAETSAPPRWPGCRRSRAGPGLTGVAAGAASCGCRPKPGRCGARSVSSNPVRRCAGLPRRSARSCSTCGVAT